MASVRTGEPGKEVRLRDALFHSSSKIFEVSEPHPVDSDFLDWILAPIEASLLAKEYTRTGMMDGYFIVEAVVVRDDGTTQKGYLDLSLPERNIDSHFLLVGGKIARGTGTLLESAKIIPSVAIEKFGVYDQYYVKGFAEVGLGVLREGLAASKVKWPIALDLAYILRDEKRFSEAIEAFTLAIQTGYTKSYFTYSERARLYQLIGNQSAAEEDWQQVERLAGCDALKTERGF
jgi:tetratricopeptide (TPR) repeat protein